MEELDILKGKITELAIKHNTVGNDLENLEESSWLEEEALMFIADYAEKLGISVNGFPQEKRILAKEEEDFDEDYFCLERFQLYVDTLSLQNENIANLNWHYVNSFWPGEFNDKADLLESIKAWIDSGVFYDVKF